MAQKIPARLLAALDPKPKSDRPYWESRNEGIHERVNFDDTIWGFDLAGGIYYNTPLRVTSVKKDSRAQKAGIRPGDKLTRINDIDTATLTIQEAHEMILESGIYIRLAVTAPEDTDTTYNCYQDELEAQAEWEEQKRREEEEKARRRRIHAKVNSNWSLQWPWVSKRRVIYKESNCYLVPSTFEAKHQDRLLKTPASELNDVVLQPKDNFVECRPQNKQSNPENAENGINHSLQNDNTEQDNEMEDDNLQIPESIPNNQNNLLNLPGKLSMEAIPEIDSEQESDGKLSPRITNNKPQLVANEYEETDLTNHSINNNSENMVEIHESHNYITDDLVEEDLVNGIVSNEVMEEDLNQNDVKNSEKIQASEEFISNEEVIKKDFGSNGLSEELVNQQDEDTSADNITQCLEDSVTNDSELESNELSEELPNQDEEVIAEDITQSSEELVQNEEVIDQEFEQLVQAELQNNIIPEMQAGLA